jgi:hypothetical protein
MSSSVCLMKLGAPTFSANIYLQSLHLLDGLLAGSDIFLSLMTNFGLKSTLPDVCIATPTCFQIPFPWNIIFMLNIFFLIFDLQGDFIVIIPYMHIVYLEQLVTLRHTTFLFFLFPLFLFPPLSKCLVGAFICMCIAYFQLLHLEYYFSSFCCQFVCVIALQASFLQTENSWVLFLVHSASLSPLIGE